MPVWKLSCSGSYLELHKHQLFVGRDDDCDLTVKHKGIDIRHAVLNYDQRLGVFRLTDLGSSHGTFVNGESVCEESVPLYVGTRIMFGKNPMVWCVEIGEPTQKQLPSDTIQQPFSQQQTGPPMPPYSPDPRPGTMSYSFQTPVYTDSPGSRLGKSYFGDPSPLERDFSLSRGNESFVPTDRARNSIGYQDSSFSDRVGTPLNTNRIPIESATPEKARVVNTQQTNTETDSVSRGAPTRARTLYGQPSWWGDGSDTFSTPPSHRKENKPDTPHPNKSIEPPNFNQSLPSAVYTHRVSYQATPPVSSRDTPATDRDPLVPQNALSSFHSANGDTRVNQKERETGPTLKRSGSYEIPLDQLDPHLSRPIIEPDTLFSTPYSGSRKSEVFVVEFGDEKSENKKTARVSGSFSEPRVLFKSSKHGTRERENKKSKVKLAFRETEPFQSADYVETGLDSCSDTELKFITPRQRPPPLSPPDISDSLLSERGHMEEIGDPVTSSTPISVTSEGHSPPHIQRLNIREDTTDSSLRKTVRRAAWQHESQKTTESAADESVREIARRLEASMECVLTRAMSLHGLLNQHFRDSLAPLPHFTPPGDPQTDTTNKELGAAACLRQIERQLENFSVLLDSINLQKLRKTLDKLQVADSSQFDTPDAPTHDSAVRRSSFDSGIILSQGERPPLATRSNSQTHTLSINSDANI